MRLFTTMLGVALMTGTFQGCESRREEMIEDVREDDREAVERGEEAVDERVDRAEESVDEAFDDDDDLRR